MKPLTIHQQRTRAPLGVFHDWQDKVPVRQRDNLPDEERALLLFADTLAALETVQEVHDEATTDEHPCGCAVCSDIDGILFTMRWLQAAFHSHLRVARREAAQLLVDVLANLRDAGEEPADPEPAAVAMAVSKETDTRPHYVWEPQE